MSYPSLGVSEEFLRGSTDQGPNDADRQGQDVPVPVASARGLRGLARPVQPSCL